MRARRRIGTARRRLRPSPDPTRPRSLCASGVSGSTSVVAFGGRDHPPAPVLRDDRHPVAGEVDRGRRSRDGRRRRRRRGAGGLRVRRARRDRARSRLQRRRSAALARLMARPSSRRARCRRPRRTSRSSMDRNPCRTGCGSPASDWRPGLARASCPDRSDPARGRARW